MRLSDFKIATRLNIFIAVLIGCLVWNAWIAFSNLAKAHAALDTVSTEHLRASEQSEEINFYSTRSQNLAAVVEFWFARNMWLV
jgi:hypothetical protein